MEELLEKKLLFFCGKGGVGKTATSLATSMQAAEKGKKVLLFSLTSIDYIEDCFGIKVNDKPTEIRKGFYCLELDAKKEIEDVISTYLKSKKLAKTLMNNTIFQSVVEAMSGFKEMLSLKKVIEYQNFYDLLIIDAPATGHSITLLNSPQKVTSLVKKGDLYELALQIDSLLKDKSKTAVNIVTILEEMAVNEAYDMHTMLQNSLISPGYIIINQMESLMNKEYELIKEMLNDSSFAPRVEEALSKDYPKKFFGQVIECNKALLKREEESRKYFNILSAKTKAKFKRVPIVYKEDKVELLNEIGRRLFQNGI